jgi:hypothetical protein
MFKILSKQLRAFKRIYYNENIELRHAERVPSKLTLEHKSLGPKGS